MAGKILRTAKDYLIPALQNFDLQTFDVVVGPPIVDKGTYIVNESRITYQGRTEVHKLGAGLTAKHFEFYQRTNLAAKFLDFAVTLTSVIATFEHALDYATSDRVHVNVVIDSEINQKLADSINAYLKRYVALCEFAQLWLPNQITYNLDFKVQWVDSKYDKPGVSPKAFVIGTNGGKDSTLSRVLLEMQGLDPYCVELYKAHLGYYREGVDDKSGIVNHYDAGDNAEFFSLLSNASTKYITSSRKPVSYDPQSNLSLLYFLPYFIHFAETGLEPKYVVLGTETACSNEWEIDGKIVPDFPFEEGLYVKRVFEQIVAAVGYETNSQLISPIAGLYEVGIVNLLRKLGNGWTIHDSCWWKEYVFRNDTPACEFCHKCLRNKLIINHLNADGSYNFDFIDKSEGSMIVTSPSMYTYSLAVNNCYHFLKGKPVDNIDYANVVLTSPDIIEFVGPELYAGTMAIIRANGFQEIPEPDYDFDLDLVPVSEIVDSIISHFYEGTDHWQGRTKYIGPATSFVFDFTMPFEDDYLISFKDTYPLHSYYNIWKFYGDDGSITRIRVDHSHNPLIESGVTAEIPTFDNPVVRNALRMSPDKIQALESYKKHGFITNYEILDTK